MDEFVSPNQGKKTNWFLIITILLIMLVVILISIILIFSFQKPMKISNEELSAGKSFELKKGQTAIFTVNNEEHELKVDSITSNSITVIIQSDKITITLRVGEDKEIDLDKDGKKDIKIELEKIENNKPVIKIIEIEDNQIGGETLECNENWECSNWSECLSEKQNRDCVDVNNCGTVINKPTEIQDCQVICSEEWECTNWSDCINNQQTRICTDNNNCNSLDNKPEEIKSCSTTQTEELTFQFSGLENNPNIILGNNPYINTDNKIIISLENDGGRLELGWYGKGTGDLSELFSTNEETSPIKPKLFIDKTIPLDKLFENYFIIDDTSIQLRDITNSEIATLWISGKPGGGNFVVNVSVGDKIQNSDITVTDITPDSIVLSEAPQNKVIINDNFVMSFEEVKDNKLIFINEGTKYIFSFFFDSTLGTTFNSNSEEFNFEQGYKEELNYVLIFPNNISMVYSARDNLFTENTSAVFDKLHIVI